MGRLALRAARHIAKEETMGLTRGARGSYETKSCPRCGAELYADMGVCYGCLYDFTRDAGHAPNALPSLAGAVPSPDDPGGDTEDLSVAASLAQRRGAEVGVVVRTASVDLWIPVSGCGTSVGRDPSNDVVLHSLAVSRRHLHMVPTSDGMEVEDLGSKNPATYRGRDVSGRIVVPYGDEIDLCGCRLVMTGPEAS